MVAMLGGTTICNVLSFLSHHLLSLKKESQDVSGSDVRIVLTLNPCESSHPELQYLFLETDFLPLPTSQLMP